MSGRDSWANLKPLVQQLGKFLDGYFDSNKALFEEPEIKALIPDIGFLINYLGDVLEYRYVILNKRNPITAILQKIDIDEGLGLQQGFSLETLKAVSRAMTDRTPTIEEVNKWKWKVQKSL